MGNVLTAGQGQAPCRQAVICAGLSSKIICTTVNKVCASGMKSVMLSADAIRANPAQDGKVYLAGGFESMTNAPHYIFHRGNQNKKLGHISLLDATIHDGLWDVYNDQHMVCRKYHRRKRILSTTLIYFALIALVWQLCTSLGSGYVRREMFQRLSYIT
jgi:acetyl-CoA acetyltransferase